MKGKDGSSLTLFSFLWRKNLNWFGLRGWKAECLQLDGVLAGRSLVYCASTR